MVEEERAEEEDTEDMEDMEERAADATDGSALGRATYRCGQRWSPSTEHVRCRRFSYTVLV